MISNLLKSLAVIAAVGLAMVGSPGVSEARNFPARGGSSSYFSDAGCWTPNGPSITNSCGTEKFWYIPLVLDGTPIAPGAGNLWVAVTAQAASNASHVRCIGTASNVGGTAYNQTGSVYLPSFGAPATIWLNLWVPQGGTGMIDCGAKTGGKVIMLNW